MGSYANFTSYQRLWRSLCQHIQLPTRSGFCSKGTIDISQSSITPIQELLTHFHVVGYCQYVGLRSLLSKITIPMNTQRISSSINRYKSTVSDIAGSSTREAPVKRFPVEIGSTLKIDLPGINAEVNVLEGADNESILLEASWNDGKATEDWNLLDVCHSKELISLKSKHEKDSSKGVFPLKGLKATIPGRWCNLEVEAGQCQVDIENMNEASVRIKTTGGDIRFGRLKGRMALIESNGGTFKATVFSAAAEIITCGGHITVEKLVGNCIKMDSGGGDVSLRSVYGENVTILSGNGKVDVEHMQVSSSNIITHGGPILINGFGGNLKILSNGGNVVVQLHDDAKQVDIDSGRGDILVLVPAQFASKVKHLGTGNLSVEGVISNVKIAPGVFLIQGQSTDSEASDLPSPVSEMTIHGSGNVLFKQRSWLESLTARLKNSV